MTKLNKIAVMALAMLTASVTFGAIGETPQQIESRRADEVSQQEVAGRPAVNMSWYGKRLNHGGVFVDNVAVIETFWYTDRHPMTSAEIERLLKPYAAFARSDVEISEDKTVHAFDLIDPSNNETFAVVFYEKQTNVLAVAFPQVFSTVAQREQAFDEPSQHTNPNRDCMLVATENLARLAGKSYWSNIILFQTTVNGEVTNSHAMACWKISADGKVYLIDNGGTIELQTTSTEIQSVLTEMTLAFTTREGRPVVVTGHFAKNASTALVAIADTTPKPVEKHNNWGKY
jgi:hypothetical protein